MHMHRYNSYFYIMCIMYCGLARHLEEEEAAKDTEDVPATALNLIQQKLLTHIQAYLHSHKGQAGILRKLNIVLSFALLWNCSIHITMP